MKRRRKAKPIIVEGAAIAVAVGFGAAQARTMMGQGAAAIDVSDMTREQRMLVHEGVGPRRRRSQAAAQRRADGEETKREILRLAARYKGERQDRAKHIARRTGKSERHVRRVLKAADI